MREEGAPPTASPSTGRARFGGQLPTVVGLLVALAAIGAYVYFFLWKPSQVVAPKVVAHLSATQGVVHVKVGGLGAWTNGKTGQALRTGDIVQTDLRSAAAITFVSGNVVTVRPDTVVLISEGDAAVAEQATAWHVQSGQVNFDLKQKTEIVTANTRTKTNADTTGSVNVTADGGTGVKIFKGSAEVSTTGGQTVVLANNQAVLVDRKGDAGPKIALPPPPLLTAPESQAELPWVHPPSPAVHLAWNGVNGAARYQVAMDYNVTQAELLLSAAFDPVEVKETGHDLAGLDPGKYFWRVAGVTSEGLEGDFSKVSIFAVLAIPPKTGAPRLEAHATDLESVVEVTGRTEPGVQLTVDGQPMKVLPDGRFSEHFRKTASTSIVVRATNASGQFTEETLPVAAP